MLNSLCNNNIAQYPDAKYVVKLYLIQSWT